MAVIQSGLNTTGLASVSGNFALYATLVPTAGGQYSAGWTTPAAGTAFTASGVSVLDFRNASGNLVLVTGISAMAFPMALLAGAAGGLQQTLALFIRRSYTAQSTTGATALTLSTNNCKLRTSYATPGVQIGFANAVGGITGGTATEDASALATVTNSMFSEDVAGAANANSRFETTIPLGWQAQAFQGPIVLAANEGLRIVYSCTTAIAAIASGQVQWSELGSTTYP